MTHYPPSPQHCRHYTAKDDDQIAYENGYSCECAGRYDQALTWYAEVQPTGGLWDMNATGGRVAVLVALGRAGEAVQHGTAGLARMQQPSLVLISEAARAWNHHRGPEHALTVWRSWASHPAISNDLTCLHGTAAYAAQCGQFAASLESLLEWLKRRSSQPGCDVLLDMDFAPLWQHLSEGRLTDAEATALRSSLWPADIEDLSVHNGRLGWESYAHLPPPLRAILCLHTTTMTWQPRPHTAQPLLRAYALWRRETRAMHFEKLLKGRRKAVAFTSLTKAE